LIEISFYSPTVSGNSDPVGRIGKWNGVKTTSIAGQRGSCAGNVKVVHTFVTEWREHPQDLRCDLSVANYKYDDDKVLWTKGKMIPIILLKKKTKTPLKDKKKNKIIHLLNGH
jgi:E3 ubiquitin-protein ligase DOA10